MISRYFLALVLTVLVTLPQPVLADPPPWAPAHGYRAKHEDNGKEYKHKHKKKHKKKHEHERFEPGDGRHAERERDDYQDRSRAVGIPEGTCYKDVVGGLLGAAAGGFLGSKVGKGDGQLAATAAGTVIGYLVGSSIGRSMDAIDQNCVGQALERAPDQRTVGWTEPGRSTRYELTPTRTFQRDGRYCRDYVVDAVVDGRPGRVAGTACRQADGTWVRS